MPTLELVRVWTDVDAHPAGNLDAELEQLFEMTAVANMSITPASESSCTSRICYTFVVDPSGA